MFFFTANTISYETNQMFAENVTDNENIPRIIFSAKLSTILKITPCIHVFTLINF